MNEKKVIGNINLLDLHQATEQSMAEIGVVGNVNLALVTTETAPLLTRLNIGNLNATVHVPSNVKLDMIFNKAHWTHAYFEQLAEPVFSMVMGKLLIEPDVTPADLEKGLNGLVIMSKVLCPETLEGALQAKTTTNYDKVQPFPAFKLFYKNSLELDESFLRRLDDDSEITVLGALTAAQALPPALLEQKVKRLFVMDEIVCCEENLESFKARVVNGSGEFKVIPAGHAVIDHAIRLDSIALETLRKNKLYCKETVEIDAEVTAEQLEKVDNLCGEGLFIVPQALKGVFAKKCDLLQNRVVFYDGLLCLVDDSMTLSTAYLDAVESKLTLIVRGELTIDPDVDAGALAARLTKVHNMGVIRCRPAQMGVLQARMGLQRGVLEDSTPGKEEPEEEKPENYLGNANYLAL